MKPDIFTVSRLRYISKLFKGTIYAYVPLLFLLKF